MYNGFVSAIDASAIDNDDPIALAVILRRARAGQDLIFFKNGQKLGKITFVRKALSDFTGLGKPSTPAAGFYSLTIQVDAGNGLVLGNSRRDSHPR